MEHFVMTIIIYTSSWSW